MHNALTFCRMFPTQNRPPFALPALLHPPPNWPMLAHSTHSMKHREFVAIVAGIRMEPRPMCRCAVWALLHFWFSCSATHTHTHPHARTDAHAHMHHAGTLWLRLRLRLCDMKYSCNRRHQNVCLQRAFNCISSARREESKSKSKYFRYVFGCAFPLTFPFPSLPCHVDFLAKRVRVNSFFQHFEVQSERHMKFALNGL